MRFHPVLALSGLCLLASCGQAPSQASKSSDIYINDAQTRHHAKVTDVVWTVWVNGCSGSFLTPKYVITANHCQPWPGMKLTSGAGLLANTMNDADTVNVPERSTDLDYAIVELQWTNGTPTSGQKYSPAVATDQRRLAFGKDGVGTKLVTVGFPVDLQQQATYAEGYAKKSDGDHIYYDVGIINGNSGGAVWRADDHTLVSLTNNGPHNYPDAGWDKNDPEAEATWNSGPAVDKIYAQSKLLQQLFPGGRSQVADATGELVK